MRGQEELTKEMIDKCLPYGQNNYEVYHENLSLDE
jgi:hypothetical protein